MFDECGAVIERLPDIKNLEINLDTKIIRIEFKNNNITKDIVQNIVDKSIISGKVVSVFS